MSLFDVGIAPDVALAAGTNFADGVKSSTLLPAVKLALSDGLEEGLVGAGPEVASDFKQALAEVSGEVGQNLGAGLSTGLEPTVATLQAELATTRKVIVVVGGGLVAITAARLIYDVFFAHRRKS